MPRTHNDPGESVRIVRWFNDAPIAQLMTVGLLTIVLGLLCFVGCRPLNDSVAQTHHEVPLQISQLIADNNDRSVSYLPVPVDNGSRTASLRTNIPPMVEYWELNSTHEVQTVPFDSSWIAALIIPGAILFAFGAATLFVASARHFSHR